MLRLATIALAVIALFAINPANAEAVQRSLLQLRHSAWTADQGAPAEPTAMAQDRSGFIWVGARDGFFRFDGFTFQHLPLTDHKPEGDRPYRLLARPDGSMWAVLVSGAVVTYRAGTFREIPALNRHSPLIELREGPDHALWAGWGGGIDLQVGRYVDGKLRVFGQAQGLPEDYLINLLPGRSGAVWASFHTGAIAVLWPGASRFTILSIPSHGHGAISEDNDGRIWLSDDIGTRIIWADGALVHSSRIYRTPNFHRAAWVMWDDVGNLWFLQSDQGVARLDRPMAKAWRIYEPKPGTLERLTKADGLTSNSNNYGLVDREGNVWLTTPEGLDRLQPTNFVAEPKLTNAAPFGDLLLGASDGSVFVAENSTLYRIAPNSSPAAVLRYSRMPEAICELSNRRIALVLEDKIAVWSPQRVDWIFGVPHAQSLHAGCAEDRAGNLWVAASKFGMLRRTKGKWFEDPRPVPPNQQSNNLAADRNRRIYVYKDDTRLTRLDYPIVRSVPVGPGTKVDTIDAMAATPDGLFFGGKFGIGLWGTRGVQVFPAANDPRYRRAVAIVQTPEGETWIKGRTGVARVATKDLLRSIGEGRDLLRASMFTKEDGVDETSIRESRQNGARGGDGRLWFGGRLGTQWIDPHRLVPQPARTTATISAVSIGGRRSIDPQLVTLPPGTSDVEIDFAAFNFAHPERIKLRYKLAGVDKDWVDPGSRRSAFYTNVEPGDYTFTVVVVGSDDVTKLTAATLEVHVKPLFTQTFWFKLLCAVPVLLLIWIAYRFRVRAVTSQLRARLETRLSERERIARELHDTLLQGFQGLILRFQSVADRSPIDTATRTLMEDALDRADNMMVEGRRRVQDLRLTRSAGAIEDSLAELGEDLAKDSDSAFRLIVEGRGRTLDVLARDEAEAIASEALRNAFRHARATTIELVIGYHRLDFRIGVRDDGRGIPPEIAATGNRAGHFGLEGMRERASRAGGRLSVESAPGSGTQVALQIPNGLAYRRPTNRPIFAAVSRWRFGRQDEKLSA